MPMVNYGKLPDDLQILNAHGLDLPQVPNEDLAT